MSKAQLLIEVDRATQIEIEELCMNQGLSISDYLVSLHKSAKGSSEVHVELTPEMKQFHDEFESNAKEGKPQDAPVMVRQKKSRGGKK